MKTKLTLGALLALLAVPSTATAGVQPPEDEDWRNPNNVASTPLDTDANDVAETVFLGVGVRKCGNVAPFDFDDPHQISADGTFFFKGKIANLAGERYKLKIQGEFETAERLVEKVTIKKGKCKKSVTLTLTP